MNKNRATTKFEIKVNGITQELTKKDIQALYEKGEIKPIGFVSPKYETESGYDILYMNDTQVVLADNFTKKIYVPTKKKQKKDVKFIIDGVFYSLTKQAKYI